MKKTLKKSMTVTMAAAMMMSLAACGNTQQDTAATPASSEAAGHLHLLQQIHRQHLQSRQAVKQQAQIYPVQLH